MKKAAWPRIAAATLSLVALSTLALVATASPRSRAGATITVSSPGDSGPGTLRQALLQAGAGDTITFDPAAFPPSSPVTIALSSELPPISQRDLTVDGSDAGVILDGTMITDPGANGLTVAAPATTIRGLIVRGFPNNGIELRDGIGGNTIGGDRTVGAGPRGQGNLVGGNGHVGILVGAGSHNIVVGNSVGAGPDGRPSSGNAYQGILIVGGCDNQVIDNLLGDNATGIGLHGPQTRHNVVDGNSIGVDESGADSVANHGQGIAITGGASHNVIGPRNVIAYNHASGVEVYGSDCEGNTITQNSIHDNGWLGIDLWGGGNGNLDCPVILDFDVEDGTVSGLSPSGSTVEVYSSEDEEGKTYEAQATADSAGSFTINTGGPFAGPRLTATATDALGNTTEFSMATIGQGGSLTLQESNNQRAAQFRALQSRHLQDNRIGSHWHGLWTYQPLSELLDEATYMGVKRFRLSINDGDHDKVDWSKPEFFVDPAHDQFVTDLAENGIKMTYFLSFWDKATYPGGIGYPCPRFQTEAEIQRYLDFVRFIVEHFKDRVQTYEIWNEPDVLACAQHIAVEDYVGLIRRAVPVIREEYPEAKIQVGGTTGLSNPDSQAYLFAILESDVMPLVDVVSWHPFYGESPESNPGYYYGYPDLVQSIRDVASAHGFEGAYEADETSWRPTSDPDPDHPGSYSEAVCAKYYGRGVVMHRGMDVTAGNLRIPHQYAASMAMVRNLATLMAGAEPTSLPLTIQTAVTDVVSYTFSRSGDDRAVSLWSDGVAAEAAAGVTATLRLEGLSADSKVVAVDPLHGFQQELESAVQAGSLVITDLVVKDYPLILHLFVPAYVYLPIVERESAP